MAFERKSHFSVTDARPVSGMSVAGPRGRAPTESGASEEIQRPKIPHPPSKHSALSPLWGYSQRPRGPEPKTRRVSPEQNKNAREFASHRTPKKQKMQKIRSFSSAWRARSEDLGVLLAWLEDTLWPAQIFCPNGGIRTERAARAKFRQRKTPSRTRPCAPRFR